MNTADQWGGQLGDVVSFCCLGLRVLRRVNVFFIRGAQTI
jgi:hypothetical protein